MNAPLDHFLPAFIKATEKTLSELCGIQISKSVVLTNENFPKNTVTVAGMIGVTSPVVEGSMSIQFPTPTFLHVMNKMLGESMTELTPGLEDGAGELSNIIFGNAKVGLNEEGFQIKMALPNVLTGQAIHRTGSMQNQKLTGVEFFTEAGSFWIVFQLNKKLGDTPPPPKTEGGLRPNWNADVLLQFVKAVKKTIEVQFNTPVEIGPPFKKGDVPFTFDVGSVIGVTDQDFNGFFGMYYQGVTFVALMNKMLGTEYTEMCDEIADGASEVTNICFGVAKQVLNADGHAIQMALPYLIRGTQMQSTSRSQGSRSTIAVPLKTPSGQFWIEFGYEEVK